VIHSESVKRLPPFPIRRRAARADAQATFARGCLTVRGRVHFAGAALLRRQTLYPMSYGREAASYRPPAIDRGAPC